MWPYDASRLLAPSMIASDSYRLSAVGCRLVVVFSGHLTDALDRPQPRFPQELETAARQALNDVLDRWGIGPDDLGICGGARGGDILFAELCVERGVQVLLSVALPFERFLETSVRLDGTDWEARYLSLIAQPFVTTEYAAWPAHGDPDEAFTAANRRMIELAREAAGSDGFRALVLWDEYPGRPRPGGTSHFVQLVDGLAQEIAIVNPCRLRGRTTTPDVSG
ncbi:MAG: hypothetical protein QOF33_2130 [Thermomicrobiales bacterium]|nr:hypothetical protein [Thermomicrobiales bacterium]